MMLFALAIAVPLIEIVVNCSEQLKERVWTSGRRRYVLGCVHWTDDAWTAFHGM
jgi:hypothetical protein